MAKEFTNVVFLKVDVDGVPVCSPTFHTLFFLVRLRKINTLQGALHFILASCFTVHSRVLLPFSQFDTWHNPYTPVHCERSVAVAKRRE